MDNGNSKVDYRPEAIRYMSFPFLYDLFAADHPSFSEKRNFFLEAARTFRYVTEIGAGTGTISLSLAASKKKITCVEPSEPVLNVLWSKILANSIYRDGVTVLPQKAQDFQLLQPAEIIIAPNLFHLIVEEEQRERILANVAKNLTPAGRFILTFFNQPVIPEEKKLTGEKTIGDLLVRRYSECNIITGKACPLGKVTWHFEAVYNKKVIWTCREDFLCRYDTAEYVKQLLPMFGFAVEEIYGDYRKAAYQEHGKFTALVVMARAAKTLR
jgi:SAM-dependent methyltransferase